MVDPREFHNALAVAGIEYAGFSCNGVDLFGTSESIDALKRWHHAAGTIPDLQAEIKRAREAEAMWKERWEAERGDHEATITHADKMLSGAFD